jgi:hypothetical protein
VLRRIFGPKRERESNKRMTKTLRNEGLKNLYTVPDIKG